MDIQCFVMKIYIYLLEDHNSLQVLLHKLQYHYWWNVELFPVRDSVYRCGCMSNTVRVGYAYIVHRNNRTQGFELVGNSSGFWCSTQSLSISCLCREWGSYDTWKHYKALLHTHYGWNSLLLNCYRHEQRIQEHLCRDWFHCCDCVLASHSRYVRNLVPLLWDSPLAKGFSLCIGVVVSFSGLWAPESLWSVITRKLGRKSSPQIS